MRSTILFLLATIFLLARSFPALGQPPSSPVRFEPAKLVYLLEYVALDYELAVRDGAIIDPFEYQEMKTFTGLLVDHVDDLRDGGASEETLRGLVELRESVSRLATPPEVAIQASALAERLAGDLQIVQLPALAPDLESGQALYATHCASCHGANGGGDGPSSAGLSPAPTSFRSTRMNRVSPRQIFGATTFGIDGTAMPAYRDELRPEQIWDIAFMIMTLRAGLDPVPPARTLPLALPDLASRSNDELLTKVRATRADVEPQHIDYYRKYPESVRRVPRLAKPDASDRSPAPLEAGERSDLSVAIGLQSAFAAVAERTVPSVVGVTGFSRIEPDGQGRNDTDDTNDTKNPNPSDPEDGGAWIDANSDERRYPGFRRARSGSGFVVDRDGSILTAYHLLVDTEGKLVDVIDIELDDGRHEIARVVGIEPTINLAVLQPELFRERPLALEPLRTGDSETARVGHWALALGNPWGPGTTFAVGTLSSRPERQCYQEDLSATLLQASLSVPAGGYGGPLVNIEGEVVGIVVPAPGLDVADLDASETPARAVEFALPINLAMEIYEALKIKQSRESPWLGISVLNLAAARKRLADSPALADLPRIGVYIDDVFEPSPAAAAGVLIGDCLVSIDGNRLLSVRNFQKWLYLSGIGRTVKLELLRSGEALEKTVTIERRPASAVPR